MKIDVFSRDEYEEPIPSKIIGFGTYSYVYGLKKKGTEKMYAIKILKDSAYSDEFLSSVNSLYRTNYPTIIKFLGVCLDKPYYLITDYVPNHTVKYYIDKAYRNEQVKKMEFG